MKKIVCLFAVLAAVLSFAMPVASAVELSPPPFIVTDASGNPLTTPSIDHTAQLKIGFMSGSVTGPVSVDIVLSTDPSAFPFNINKSNYLQTLVNNNGVYVYDFNMTRRADAAAGYYTIFFKVTLQNGDYCTVPVVMECRTIAPAENGGSTPKITISSYRTNPDPVVAGEEIILDVTFKNNGKAAASNLKAQLSSDGTFSAVSGSSSMFVDTIGAGQSASCSIKLKVKADVAPGSYNVTFAFAYDVSGFKDPFSDTEVVAIPVLQVPKLQLTPLQTAPTDLFAGGEMNIMTTLNNTGRSKLFNVTAKFTDSNGIFTEQEKYIGTVEPGASANIDEYLTALMEGETSVILTITYENEEGDPFTYTADVSVFVMDKGGIIDPLPVPEPKPSAGFSGWWIIVVVVLIGGGLAALFLIRKKKKSDVKKQRDKAHIEQLERQFFSEQQARAAEASAAPQPQRPQQQPGNEMHTAEMNAASFTPPPSENSGASGNLVFPAHEQPLPPASNEEQSV